jgi:hypothetical protein
MDVTRPFMSGFGIDLIRLMNTSGWPSVNTQQDKDSPGDSSWIAGLFWSPERVLSMSVFQSKMPMISISQSKQFQSTGDLSGQ